MKNIFMHPDQLATLEAIAEAGTFEAAASRLGISTSAASQRVRALESALGRILVRRTNPCTMTDDGAVVLRYARAQALLARELGEELALGEESSGDVELAVAVNADSLATWFPSVLREAAHWPARLRLLVADESRTEELLRSGRVMAAISTASTRIAGCRVEPLGTLVYEPVAAPELLDSHPDPEALPMLRFDADDDLQAIALESAGQPVPAPRAQVPTPSGFLAAVEAGLGWGMVPRPLLGPGSALAPVPGLEPVERALFWHRWSIRSAGLDRLTRAVRQGFSAVA